METFAQMRYFTLTSSKILGRAKRFSCLQITFTKNQRGPRELLKKHDHDRWDNLQLAIATSCCTKGKKGKEAG